MNINTSKMDEQIIKSSKEGNLFELQGFSNSVIRSARCRAGCSVLHWAAGSNHLNIVHYLLLPTNNEDAEENECRIFTNVDLQVNSKLAKGRTPLHYACRNGHLEVVRTLIEKYGANPATKAKQGVTPFQLAVWQNRFDVCRYLVEECGVVASDDVNIFGCGPIHWLGIIPSRRANFQNSTSNGDGSDNEKSSGEDLMPLAKWLISQPNIDVHAKQNQGHTVLHKAAWGAHLALVKYLHQEHNMYDNNTDIAGNYAADLCDMQNTEQHKKVALYLRRECSMERLESFQVLGLEGRTDASHDEIRKAYLEKAKMFHPDAQMRRKTNQIDDNIDKKVDFDRLRQAYEHLTLHDGISTKQRNPAHSINLLLQMQSSTTPSSSVAAKKSCKLQSIPSEDDDLFKARLLAVLLEYGDKGLNLSNLPKKWDQVWPSNPFNSMFDGQKRKNGEVLNMIKDRASDVVRVMRTKPEKEEGNVKLKKGKILLIPRHLSRNDVLKYASDKSMT